jgi:FKBP-type peptidyl-prolyl cis-trans isomerase
MRILRRPMVENVPLLIAAALCAFHEPRRAWAAKPKLTGDLANALEKASRDAPGTLLPSGIRLLELYEGAGVEAAEGAKVYCHYKFWTGGFDRGMPVEASYFRTRPIAFVLGAEGADPELPGGGINTILAEAIRGGGGLPLMREGGWRRLVVPASLAFGAAGLPRTATISQTGVAANERLFVDMRLMDAGSGKCERVLYYKGAKSISCEVGKP